MLGHEGFVVLEPGDEPELRRAANVAPRALLERLQHPGFVAGVEPGAVGGHRFTAKPERLHWTGVEMATQQLDVMDAVLALEERHERTDQLVGRDARGIEHRPHGGRLPARKRRAVQLEQAKPNQQAGDRTDDLAAPVEYQVQGRAAPARLEPRDPRVLVHDAAVGEAGDEGVPIGALRRRSGPDDHRGGVPGTHARRR